MPRSVPLIEQMERAQAALQDELDAIDARRMEIVKAYAGLDDALAAVRANGAAPRRGRPAGAGGKAAPTKRRLSAAGRAAISKAAKKRWAAARKAAKSKGKG